MKHFNITSVSRHTYNKKSENIFEYPCVSEIEHSEHLLSGQGFCPSPRKDMTAKNESFFYGSPKCPNVKTLSKGGRQKNFIRTIFLY